MSEYSVYFNPPGFDDYPRTVQATVEHVALNAHVEKTDVDDIYVKGSAFPSSLDNNKIWIHVPSATNGPVLPPIPPLPPPTGGNITNVLFCPSTTPQTSPIGAPMFDVVDPSTGSIVGTTMAGDFLTVSETGKYYARQYNDLTAVYSIVRYNSDYTLDGTFSPIDITGSTSSNIKLKFTVDNKFILYAADAVAAPGVSLIINGVDRGLIARFNNDGSFDSTFVTGTGFTWTANPYFPGQPASIKDVSVQSNNKILIVGEFDTYKGTTLSANRIGLVRLNENGDLDTTFIPYKSFATTASAGGVSFLQPTLDIVFSLPSGNILIGQRTASIQSLLSNGYQNTSFSNVSVPTLQAPSSALVQAQNNKIYHYGVYSLIRFDAETGELDTTFTNNFTSNVIVGLAISPDGSLFVRYTNISGPPNPTTQVRLLSNGSLNNSFSPIVVPALVGGRPSGVKINPVVNSAPIIFLDEVLYGYINIPFSYAVSTSNSVNTFSASGLPPGLSINSSTGLISGTLSSSSFGIFTLTVTATNTSGSSTRSSNLIVSSGIWTGDSSPLALRKNLLDVWWAFENITRGDIIIVPDDQEILFPWGESGKVYDMSPWGEPNFLVPTLPTPPTGFKYKYYIGAQISQPVPPVITL